MGISELDYKAIVAHSKKLAKWRCEHAAELSCLSAEYEKQSHRSLESTPRRGVDENLEVDISKLDNKGLPQPQGFQKSLGGEIFQYEERNRPDLDPFDSPAELSRWIENETNPNTMKRRVQLLFGGNTSYLGKDTRQLDAERELYREARGRAMRFSKVAPSIVSDPLLAETSDPHIGLQNVLAWCVQFEQEKFRRGPRKKESPVPVRVVNKESIATHTLREPPKHWSKRLRTQVIAAILSVLTVLGATFRDEIGKQFAPVAANSISWATAHSPWKKATTAATTTLASSRPKTLREQALENDRHRSILRQRLDALDVAQREVQIRTREEGVPYTPTEEETVLRNRLLTELRLLSAGPSTRFTSDPLTLSFDEREQNVRQLIDLNRAVISEIDAVDAMDKASRKKRSANEVAQENDIRQRATTQLTEKQLELSHIAQERAETEFNIDLSEPYRDLDENDFFQQVYTTSGDLAERCARNDEMMDTELAALRWLDTAETIAVQRSRVKGAKYLSRLEDIERRKQIETRVKVLSTQPTTRFSDKRSERQKAMDAAREAGKNS